MQVHTIMLKKFNALFPSREPVLNAFTASALVALLAEELAHPPAGPRDRVGRECAEFVHEPANAGARIIRIRSEFEITHAQANPPGAASQAPHQPCGDGVLDRHAVHRQLPNADLVLEGLPPRWITIP